MSKQLISALEAHVSALEELSRRQQLQIGAQDKLITSLRSALDAKGDSAIKFATAVGLTALIAGLFIGAAWHAA